MTQTAAQFELTSVQPSKPPLRWLHGVLTLHGAADGDVWFVLPCDLDQDLRELVSGVRAAELQQAGGGERYVVVYGDSAVTLLRVRSGTEIVIGDWAFGDSKNLDTFEIWSVRNPVISGAGPIEQLVEHGALTPPEDAPTGRALLAELSLPAGTELTLQVLNRHRIVAGPPTVEG